MSNEKHTRLPKLYPHTDPDGGLWLVQSKDGSASFCKLTRYGDRAEGLALQDALLRACNSHEALVKALEKCHATLQQFAVHNDEKEAMAEARAALKQAKENA